MTSNIPEITSQPPHDIKVVRKAILASFNFPLDFNLEGTPFRAETEEGLDNVLRLAARNNRRIRVRQGVVYTDSFGATIGTGA